MNFSAHCHLPMTLRWLVTAGWLLWLGSGCSKPKPTPPAPLPSATTVNPTSPASQLTAEQLISLVARSLALLENGWEVDHNGKLLQEAQSGFERLAAQFPQDPFGQQNLCVTLLGRLRQTDRTENAQQFANLQTQLQSELTQLHPLTPGDPVADILAARGHLLVNDTAAAIDSYRAAAKEEQADAAVFYQLYNQLNAADAEGSTMEAGQALEQAFQLAPTNLAVVVERLRFLARTQNDQLVDAIEASRILFRPLTSRTSSAIPKLLDTASQAARDGKWQIATVQTNFLRNVCLAEIAFQHALHLLDPHSLEFVRLELSPASLTALAVPDVHVVPALSFAARSEPALTISQGTALITEDFDLDGAFDVWCAEENRLQIYGFASATATELLCTADVEIAVTGMAAADLDHDFQQRKDALPASALPTTTPPTTAEDLVPTAVKLTPEQMIEKYLDTDLDLVVYGPQGVRLLRNDLDAPGGTRSLTVVPQTDGLDKLTNVRSVAVIDFDHDSDLDLAISSDAGISLWSNRGDWTFADFSEYSQLPQASTVVSDILAFDADRNVLNDFLLASETSRDSLILKSNLHGRYFLQSEGWPEQGFGGLHRLAAIDANADACWDIIGCGTAGTRLTTMQAVGHQGWQPASRRTLSTTPMQGLLVEDFDNDGFDDCLTWGEAGMEFFRRGSDGTFAKDPQVVPQVGGWQQVAALDFDNDHDLDLVGLASDGRLQLLQNQGGSASHHLELVIRADEDGKQRPRERSNMHGVGSLIEMKTGSIYQSRIVRGTRTWFGLGEHENVDVLRVLWTNGIPNNVIDISDASTVYDQQNLGGSCPYLYAWNGERFEFCTDCLWAAPIGLQFAQGQAAPTRDWEYLQIEGHQLAPRAGQYILQLTEELWEAAYFDSVQLLAVDHPPHIEVFTNEKVGPAEIAEFKIHTVHERKFPRTVIDARGRDLSHELSARDQIFTRTWQYGLNQGLTDDHYLEIDFGPLEDPSQLTLFLTGWMFPTSTSINLSMAENPLKPRQKPPAIWMPNEQGEWVETMPYVGFPGGKTKTIAIDLADKFLCADYRIRLVSNMELCWDELFYSDNPPSGPTDSLYRIEPQKLQHAEIHYRGFSKMTPQLGNAPKRFEYDQVNSESIWPPMLGNFTRYGEVTELVLQPDDRQVVMGAGDEMTLQFQASGLPVPDGWVRDFIVYNVGWDKDADLNTIHGQSVEPLPFRDMRQYPYAPEQAFPDAPEHRRFLETYQTRQQAATDFWHQIRDY